MITFQNVYKAYEEKPVLVNVSLTIESGEFLILIGSSGCGKTTLLKMINKLNTIDRGDILIDGVSIKKMGTTKLRRQIGYVVQDGGLFPHLTVAENIGLILKILGGANEDNARRVDELLEMVELDPSSYRSLYPSQLSGGQRQRVGVARAFSADPEIILMDEPFSALDPMTRSELQDAICRLQKRYHKTVIFVTHDMDEGIKLADRICMIQNGRIVQCDTPENILKNPASNYVEEFIGKNRLWENPEFVKANDIMLSKPHQISSDRTLFQAMQVMKHHSIDSVLVTEQKKLLGIIWLNDLTNTGAQSGTLRDFLSEDYVSVYEDTSLQKIISTIDYNISGIIPVVRHNNELVGYLTKSVLLSTLSKQYVEEKIAAERSGTI